MTVLNNFYKTARDVKDKAYLRQVIEREQFCQYLNVFLRCGFGSLWNKYTAQNIIHKLLFIL